MALLETELLSDEQIDRLLVEAEQRLADKSTQNTVALPVGAPGSVTLAQASPAKAEGIDEAQGTSKQSKELSVRVPKQLVKDKSTKDHAGKDWHNMPRTKLTPELKKDLQLLRMRSILSNGKQYFKKDTRRELVPEFSQVGTIIEGNMDSQSSRLTRRERKRTILEEVLSTSDALAKFKTKYSDIQTRKMSGKKGHYKKLVAQRRRRG